MRELIRDSRVAFEGKPGNAALWRSRVLCELETDGPWFDRMRDAWLQAVAERGLQPLTRNGEAGQRGEP